MWKVIAKNGNEWHNIYNDSWLVTAENNKTAAATEPVLTIEDNQAGTFKITIPPENNGYDFIERYSTEIIVYRVDRKTTSNTPALVETEVFRGRVTNESENFLRHRILTCEGELNYLKDTRQPHKRYSRTLAPASYFSALLKIHNSKAEKKKQFKMGNCEFATWSDKVTEQIDTEDEQNDDVLYRDTQYEDTLTCISDAFEDLDHPHLRVRWTNGVRYLDFLKDSRDGGTFGATLISNQEVTLEKNLLDYSKNYDLNDICSVIIPLGAQIEGDKIHLGPPISFEYYPTWTEFGVGGAVLNPSTHLPQGIDDVEFQISNPIPVEPNKKYFYTGCQWNGYGMYTFIDENGNVLEYKNSNESDSHDGHATDLIEYVITAPDNAKYVYIAGYGETIPMRLNSYIEDNSAQLEQYVTVSEIVDNTPGRKKKKGTNYVTSKPLLEKYGWIERVVEFPNVKTPQVLYNRAIKYFEEDVFENLEFEVKALDLNLLDSSITPYSVGKSVHVFSKRHNIDKNFPITKLEIHLDDPSNSTVTLGYKTKLSISKITTASSAKIYKKVEAVRLSESGSLKEAIDRATYLIKNGMNGYVTLVRDPQDNEVIREIVIADNADYTQATKVWRWNAGGLGYSSTGYNDTTFRANLALTSDGEIVADRITTGHLSADRIKGGVLYLGGGNDSSGNPIHGWLSVLDETYRDGDSYVGHVHYSLNKRGFEVIEPRTDGPSNIVGRIGSYDTDGGGDSMDLYIQTRNPTSESGYGNIFVVSTRDITLMPKSGNLYVGRSWDERYKGASATVNLNQTRLIFKHGLLVGSEPIE